MTFGGGAEGVQLQASAISDEVSLSHWSKEIDPDLLMESASNTDDYFVSFAVLSDMGYGDMLDTQVSVHSSANDSLLLAVKSETLQARASIDSVFLTIPVVEGLTLTPSTTDMTCDQTASAWVCELPELTTNTDHLFGFDVAAEDGEYSMQVDVEHRDYHVDGAPLNNFHNVALSFSSITNVTITGATVTTNKAAGDTVGTLAADHARDADVTFTLVDGAGDNADFDVDGDKIITRGSLARTNNGTYSLSVVASDGTYSVESTVSVTVNIAAVVTPAPPSSGGGGGCTVGQPGNSDSTFPMILLGMALLIMRRRLGFIA
ncbi:MAG TPA: hypothetical protein DCL66_08540 [Gammaproteobacteria bacterium]|nr:hypothetical protein [Gammaproteobacteria bacterium]